MTISEGQAGKWGRKMINMGMAYEKTEVLQTSKIMLEGHGYSGL